jgi:hypothetical protein
MSGETSYAPPAAALDVVGRWALITGIVGAVLCVAALFVNPAQFFRSYLVAFTDGLGLALGCLAIWMLSIMSGGAWGVMIRRILEASARTLPFFGLLAIPVLLGVKHLYPWADAARVASDEILRHKAPYLNTTFFAIRLVVTFALWIVLAFALSRLSRRQDETGDPGLGRRMQMIAGPGLGLYGLLVSFFAIDLLMSLDLHWFSTIYGIYIVGGQAVSGMSFAIVAAVWLGSRKPMEGVYQARHLHDWGKLLLAFTMLWSYFAISQFLIIWSGDLPEEIGFFKDRLSGGWGAVSLLLVLFHWMVPFLLLLSRDLKRNGRKLAAVALLLLVMRWLDMHWLVAPVFSPGRLTFSWMDVATPAAVLGFWLFLFVGQLKSRPLLPVHDPGLPAALEIHAHG